jgi:hypothetical protein
VLIAIAVAPVHAASAQQNAAAQQRAMLAGVCGASFRQTVQLMMAGRLSGGQATQCWCYFWEKAGSNSITMYKGQRAADFCPRYLVSAPPPVPAQGARTVDTVPQGNQGNAPGTNPQGDWTPPGSPPPEQIVPGRTPTTTTQRPPEIPGVNNPPGTPQMPTTAERPPAGGTPPTTADRQPPPGNGGNPPPGTHDRQAGGTPGGGTPHNDRVSRRPTDDCPQRGKGCVALIIDFSRAFEREDNFLALSSSLKAVGCEVKYLGPQLQAEQPLAPPTEQLATERWNDQELAKVQIATDLHRSRVAQGAELVIEIIKGHGRRARECGAVHPNYTTGESPAIYIPRYGFHMTNYKAVRNNACAWFVADFSCFSGLTSEAIDILSNRGLSEEPVCTTMPRANCRNHAAYEFDVAFGSATSDLECTFPDSRKFNKGLVEVVKAATAQGGVPLSGRPGDDSLAQRIYQSARLTMPSLYSDGGRKYCEPQHREGYWKDFKPRR